MRLTPEQLAEIEARAATSGQGQWEDHFGIVLALIAEARTAWQERDRTMRRLAASQTALSQLLTEHCEVREENERLRAALREIAESLEGRPIRDQDLMYEIAALRATEGEDDGSNDA